MLEETSAGLKAELLEIGEIADANMAKIKNLQAIEVAHFKKVGELEEARREGAARLFKSLNVGAVRDALHRAFDNLQDAYDARIGAREALRNAKDNHDVVLANAIIEVKMSNSFDPKDPATGRSNKEWVEQQVSAFLEKHTEYQQAKAALSSAQVKNDTADMDLELARQMLSVARNEARIVAAMLGAGGQNG